MKNESPLSVEVALDTILSSTPRLETEMVSIENALGRILAEDVSAKDDLPPFDNSAMDGYAVIAQDTLGVSKDAPRILKVLAEAPAGTVVAERVVAGTAVRIMTGAPVPQGADSVVMVEDTSRNNDEVCVYREAKRGANIRLSGDDVKQGELVIRSGRRIKPADMGMLAALGRAEVLVSKVPRVAIITSGNELVDVAETPRPGQIRDSNQYSLLGQVLRAGAEVSICARVVDEREEFERVLSKAAATSDLLIASGGVSVGDYDFVKDTLAKLGDIRFWKAKIKPGKPIVYGHINGIPLFGLPGNPVSSMVTFDLFVRPCLYRMMGLTDAPYRMVSGILNRDIRHKPVIREFIRAITRWTDGRYSASPTGQQGSGRLSSMLEANSYIVIPEDTGDLFAGDDIQIMLFE